MKIISILLLLVSLVSAKTYDATDSSKSVMISVPMVVCGVALGTKHGLYVNAYQEDERSFTCKELAPLFREVTVLPYSAGKKKSGNVGSIGFGKKPNHCSLQLSKTNGELTGIPYGNKSTCSSIRTGATALLWEDTKKKEPKVPHVVKILKYGSPHGSGRSFPSQNECEQEKAKLSKANAGLDYSYKCVKR